MPDATRNTAQSTVTGLRANDTSGTVDAADKDRIVAQDRRLELTQHRRRLQAKLLPQHAAKIPVDLERFCLPAATVEGEHELTAKTLPHRVLADELLQLGCEYARRPEGQTRLDPLLQARQVQLLQPGDLGLRERLVTKIGQRRALPQRKRLVQRPRRVRRGARRERIAALG